MSNRDYPGWICMQCGLKYGRKGSVNEHATWHFGECGVCGEPRTVTEPRDFGHLTGFESAREGKDSP